jgi:hypothetical protein
MQLFAFIKYTVNTKHRPLNCLVDNRMHWYKALTYLKSGKEALVTPVLHKVNSALVLLGKGAANLASPKLWG